MSMCNWCAKSGKCLEQINFKDNQFCFNHIAAWKWYERPEIWFRRGIQVPWENFCTYIKRFIQRGIRGWGDEDLWNMHYFLTDLVLNMLVELKRITVHDLTFNNLGEDLDKVIEGFSILKKCDEEELERRPKNISDKKILEFEKSMKEKYPNWRVTTKEEELKIKKAFELLYKIYERLWD